jgi:hypothetical protein
VCVRDHAPSTRQRPRLRPHPQYPQALDIHTLSTPAHPQDARSSIQRACTCLWVQPTHTFEYTCPRRIQGFNVRASEASTHTRSRVNMHAFSLRVQGTHLCVQGARLRVLCTRLRVSCTRLRVQRTRLRVPCTRLRVPCTRLLVQRTRRKSCSQTSSSRFMHTPSRSTRSSTHARTFLTYLL